MLGEELRSNVLHIEDECLKNTVWDGVLVQAKNRRPDQADGREDERAYFSM
jgi:hypothetical protein